MNQNSGCGHDAEYVWVWEECEHQAPPAVCATEGGTCECLGMVYYGRRFDDTSNEITTLEAMLNFDTFNQSSTSSLPCTNAQFGDPAPAGEKQCICEFASTTIEKRVAARGSYVEDYRCDSWSALHAVRCCVVHHKQRREGLPLWPLQRLCCLLLLLSLEPCLQQRDLCC